MRSHLCPTFLLGVLALACQRQRAPEPSTLAPPATPRAWTLAFQTGAVLVADEISIEGPSDLLNHVALLQDPDTTIYSTKTTSAGLLQELRARPQVGAEVHAQLDGWSLAAFQRITVLQRPGEVPVTVRALGNAYWSGPGPGGKSDERRDKELVFRGARGK